jgi:uncharacterized membrane protein
LKEGKKMKKVKQYLNHVFIDGLSGMALGLFSTLIVGTILEQIGKLIGGSFGDYVIIVAGVCKALTGAGIGVGVAHKFKESPLVTISAAATGMVGAFAAKILAGTVVSGSVVTLAGPGEPLGAFIAAFVGIEIGHLVSGKTKVDILVSPIVTIGVGSAVGLLVGPPITDFMSWIGGLINWGTQQQPILMGIVVSVLMGIALTLPISSAAIGVSLGLSGIAAGAASVGCTAQMVGFAVASFRENKFGGLVSQGIGTSMLQMPNIIKKPIIWLPPILTSAVLGPISTAVLGMTNNAIGSGMGSAGLVGQIMGYQTMVEGGTSPVVALVLIAVMHFILPAVLTLTFSEIMRKAKLIKFGDMKLNV